MKLKIWDDDNPDNSSEIAFDLSAEGTDRLRCFVESGDTDFMLDGIAKMILEGLETKEETAKLDGLLNDLETMCSPNAKEVRE